MIVQIILYCPECQSARVKKMVKRPNRANKIFAVKFAKEPEKLNIEMQDFTHDGSVVNCLTTTFV